MFIDVAVTEDEAEGAVAEMYELIRGHFGYVPNHTLLFSHRPALWQAYSQLEMALAETIDRRRYELAAISTALQRRSTYCAVAHTEMLIGMGLGTQGEVAALANGGNGQLTEDEQAVVAYASKAASDPSSITAADIDRLRAAGLADDEILDVAVAVAVRCFYATVLDALGALPDHQYRQSLPATLIDALTVGRPVAEATAEG